MSDSFALGLVGLLDLGVHLVGGLVDEERTAGDQDQVLPRQGKAHDFERRLGEADDPGDHQQQRDTEYQCERQAQAASTVGLLLGQARNQDRDEDDVVDAEDGLEQRERGERDPGLWVGEPVHGSSWEGFRVEARGF